MFIITQKQEKKGVSETKLRLIDRNRKSQSQMSQTYNIDTLRLKFFAEAVEAISLAVDWKLLLCNLVEKVRLFVNTVLANIDILFLNTFWTTLVGQTNMMGIFLRFAKK